MTTNDSSSDNPRTRVTKKPYEKPAFRYEQIFVTTALSCGKISGDVACHHNHKVS